MPCEQFNWKEDGYLAAKWEIEVEFVHELKELYKRIHTWFQNEGFSDFNGQDTYETLYWQKDHQNGLQEHQMWWRAWKYPGATSHQNKFFKWFVKLNYQTIAVSKKEVMHKGKKWKLYQSNTILRFECHLIHQPLNEFDKGILKGIKSRYKNWIYKDKVKHFENELIFKCIDLQNSIKAFLELKQDKEQPASIYPPSMLP